MFARALSIRLGALGFQSVLCFPSPPEPAVREFLSLANVVVEAVPAVFEGGFHESGWSFIRLLRLHRPVIVHLHYMGLISPFPWLARVFGVKKFFVTDHGSRPEAHLIGPQPWWKRIAKTAIHNPIDCVVVVSEFVLRSQLAFTHLAYKRFELIHNGIDLERVATAATIPNSGFRSRFSIPADSVLITQVSWLIEEKGVSDFIEAARMVISVYPQAHFCIVGTGPCMNQQKQAVASSDLDSCFTFTGQLADPFFEGVFSASDIICQPSRWDEAFGWVIGEAMAFGKPVVATRVGGIPEIVRDQVTGFLVERRDPVELSRRLIQLAADQALRQQMGTAGAQEIRDRFALESNIREHMLLYEILPSA